MLYSFSVVKGVDFTSSKYPSRFLVGSMVLNDMNQEELMINYVTIIFFCFFKV